jgi:hypothetical protein
VTARVTSRFADTSRSLATACSRRWTDTGSRTAVAIRLSAEIRGRPITEPYPVGVTSGRILARNNARLPAKRRRPQTVVVLRGAREALPMLLIDAANVIGARPTGWWRDRPAAARDFVTRVRRAAREGVLPGPVVLVLEGAAKKGVEEGLADGVEVLHAPGHGDDTLAARAAEADEDVMLVSADRHLGERVRAYGADVVGPTWLLDRLAP